MVAGALHYLPLEIIWNQIQHAGELANNSNYNNLERSLLLNKHSIERAKKMAREINLDAEFIIHDETGKTTEDAEKALGISSENILKTLILYASKEEKYVGVIILGSDRLNIKHVAKISNSKKLRFATNEQIEKLTGFSIGGVPPIAINFCSQKYIDNKVCEKEFVIGAGGDEFCGMKIVPKQLIEKISIECIDAT